MAPEPPLSPDEYIRWLNDNPEEINRLEISIDPDDRADLAAVFRKLEELSAAYSAASSDPERQLQLEEEGLPFLIDLLGGIGLLSVAALRHNPGEFKSPGRVYRVFNAVKNREDMADFTKLEPSQEAPVSRPSRRSEPGPLEGREG